MSSDLYFRGFLSLMRDLLLVLSSLETEKKLEDRLPAFFFIRYFLEAVHKNKQKSPPYCLLEKYLLLWISIDLLPERL